MTTAPADIVAYFGVEEEQLDLHEIRWGGDPSLGVEPNLTWSKIQDGFEALDSTLLAVWHSRGVDRIAVKHGERIVEFDLRAVLVRDVPLVAVVREQTS